MGKLIDLLDLKIENYLENSGDFPTLIITSEDSYRLLRKELEDLNNLQDSWFDFKDNYKGIHIEMKPNTLFELK